MAKGGVDIKCNVRRINFHHTWGHFISGKTLLHFVIFVISANLVHLLLLGVSHFCRQSYHQSSHWGVPRQTLQWQCCGCLGNCNCFVRPSIHSGSCPGVSAREIASSLMGCIHLLGTGRSFSGDILLYMFGSYSVQAAVWLWIQRVESSITIDTTCMKNDS